MQNLPSPDVTNTIQFLKNVLSDSANSDLYRFRFSRIYEFLLMLQLLKISKYKIKISNGFFFTLLKNRKLSYQKITDRKSFFSLSNNAIHLTQDDKTEKRGNDIIHQYLPT